MENRFPKNVRQIGNVSDAPKIYIEDYVDTFLNQLCDKTDETPEGAFLIGHTVRQEGQECVYISGAVRMELPETSELDIVISGEIWDKAESVCREYFEEGEMIGWFVSQPGQPLLLNDNLIRQHEKYFGRPGTVFIMRDAVEKEELFFAYKYKELMQMGGHYIYYEKNPSMQNYMISVRKKIGVTPSESVEDQAAKDFRNLVKERFEVQEQRKNSRFMYAASVFLVLVVLIIGVTTINNYDKMRSVQSSIEDIKKTVSPDKEEQETVAVSGDVVAQTGEPEVKSDSAEDSAGGTETVSPEGEADDTKGEQNVQEPNNADTRADDTAVSSAMQDMSDDIYIVEKGDTLAKISKKVYGDIGHVDAICRMNGLSDGNLIFIGQKLLLP